MSSIIRFKGFRKRVCTIVRCAEFLHEHLQQFPGHGEVRNRTCSLNGCISVARGIRTPKWYGDGYQNCQSFVSSLTSDPLKCIPQRNNLNIILVSLSAAYVIYRIGQALFSFSLTLAVVMQASSHSWNQVFNIEN